MDGVDGSATRWTAWGRAASSRFDGDSDGLGVDGEAPTFTLGADAAWDRWLTGVAVSLSEGEGGFRDHADRGHPGKGSGTWGAPAMGDSKGDRSFRFTN